MSLNPEDNPEQIKVCSWQDADKVITYICVNIMLIPWSVVHLRQQAAPFAAQGTYRDGPNVNPDREPYILPSKYDSDRKQEIESKQEYSDPCWYSLKNIVVQEMKKSRAEIGKARLSQNRPRKYGKQRSRNPKT